MAKHNSAVTEIPDFKLAKVGKGRERKRAGAGWLGARGAGSAFSGAAGGSGAGAGFAGMSLAKTLLSLAIAASLSAGAWQFGRSFSGKPSGVKPVAKKMFTDKASDQYADTSKVIKAENSIPNSMGYISGSLDGMTPEERAKKQAEAEAARAAEEAAAKKAAEEDAKKAAAAEAPAPVAAPIDPATIASANAKKGLGEGKFGKLGSSLGGGGGHLSGGAGLSGGINRNFGASSMGGMKPNSGAMAAFRSPSKPGYTSAGRAVAGRSKAQGFAKRQLENAFSLSHQAVGAGKTENAAATAASAFDNNIGAGNVISGPGLNNGAKQGTADGGVNPTPSNGGGPLSAGGAPCASDSAPDINGNCQKIKTNGPGGGPDYQWMIDAVKGLMIALTILGALAYFADDLDAFFGSGEAIKSAIRIMIGVVGAAICGLGLMLLSASGDNVMGGIIAAVGAFALATAIWPETLGVGDDLLTQMAVGPMLAGVAGLLAASNVKQPAAMQ
jgi:hypothetical protein